MITSMDVVNMGYTEAAAKLLIPDISLSPSMNWYFSAVSVVFLTFFSTLITVKVVEPRMGRYTGDYVEQADDPTPLDNKGLKAALIAFLAYIALIVVLCVTGCVGGRDRLSAQLQGASDERNDRAHRPDVRHPWHRPSATPPAASKSLMT